MSAEAERIMAEAASLDVHVWHVAPRRTTFIAPAPDTYENWLKHNHPDEWRSLQPEAVTRYEDLQRRLRGMRPDSDDLGKYGRSFSAEDNA